MSIDFNSPTWQTIADWARARQTESLIANGRPGVPEREADWYRGRISIAGELLSLPQQEIVDDG